jgi:hypothetical protein
MCFAKFVKYYKLNLAGAYRLKCTTASAMTSDHEFGLSDDEPDQRGQPVPYDPVSDWLAFLHAVLKTIDLMTASISNASPIKGTSGCVPRWRSSTRILTD